MNDNGVITVRDLRRRYSGTGGRGFDAVRGVTFSLRRGELFALLGTNGAGKTSTMEVLEGLAPAAQGAVRVLGCDPCRERALVRRRMGIMLQEGGFPPDLTVAETGRMWAGTLSAPRPVAGNRRRRSPPRPRRDLQRGRHPGARAHRLDYGGRLGGTTLVPLGTTALSKRDRLEG